jgi:chromosomal replication initiation ATPase DnaA
MGAWRRWLDLCESNSPGRRNHDASRTVAAWLARRRFGYNVRDIAEALGYRSHGGVVTAIGRVQAASQPLRRTLRKLERQLGSGYRHAPH